MQDRQWLIQWVWSDEVSDALVKLKPDICLIHGDRFDALSVAIVANLLNIVVAHIEGGELSGTVDGDLRHAITKLSHLHFACSEDAVFRIRSMGENSEYIFLTGCPSYERLFSLKDTSWEEFGVNNSFPTLAQRSYILALMHPCVTDEEQSLIDYECFLRALFTMKRKTVFLYPNIDPGNKRMIQVLHKYQKQHRGWHGWLHVQTHIAPDIFAVLMRDAAVMIGNSSSAYVRHVYSALRPLTSGRDKLALNSVNVTTYEHPKFEEVIEWTVHNFERRLTRVTFVVNFTG